ncbi:hypothetical protein JHW43_000702 [Diplocarpon mali]|nr:hypothetical protein JHW43_000702 [Diplocarpon mali]
MNLSSMTSTLCLASESVSSAGHACGCGERLRDSHLWKTVVRSIKAGSSRSINQLEASDSRRDGRQAATPARDLRRGPDRRLSEEPLLASTYTSTARTGLDRPRACRCPSCSRSIAHPSDVQGVAAPSGARSPRVRRPWPGLPFRFPLPASRIPHPASRIPHPASASRFPLPASRPPVTISRLASRRRPSSGSGPGGKDQRGLRPGPLAVFADHAPFPVDLRARDLQAGIGIGTGDQGHGLDVAEEEQHARQVVLRAADGLGEDVQVEREPLHPGQLVLAHVGQDVLDERLEAGGLGFSAEEEGVAVETEPRLGDGAEGREAPSVDPRRDPRRLVTRQEEARGRQARVESHDPVAIRPAADAIDPPMRSLGPVVVVGAGAAPATATATATATVRGRARTPGAHGPRRRDALHGVVALEEVSLPQRHQARLDRQLPDGETEFERQPGEMPEGGLVWRGGGCEGHAGAPVQRVACGERLAGHGAVTTGLGVVSAHRSASAGREKGEGGQISTRRVSGTGTPRWCTCLHLPSTSNPTSRTRFFSTNAQFDIGGGSAREKADTGGAGGPGRLDLASPGRDGSRSPRAGYVRVAAGHFPPDRPRARVHPPPDRTRDARRAAHAVLASRSVTRGPLPRAPPAQGCSRSLSVPGRWGRRRHVPTETSESEHPDEGPGGRCVLKRRSPDIPRRTRPLRTLRSHTSPGPSITHGTGGSGLPAASRTESLDPANWKSRYGIDTRVVTGWI